MTTESSSSTSETEGSEAEMYKKEQVLRDLLINQGLTRAEAGEELGVHASTVSKHARKHGIGVNVPDYDIDIPDVEKPYKDRQLMERLYVEEEYSTTDISHILDCSTGAVNEWLEKHGIDRRSSARAGEIWRGHSNTVAFYSLPRGHEYVRSRDQIYEVHRLVAMAEWGVDAVVGNHVHHKNGIPWDNRVENLELMSNSDHQQTHLKFDGLDRIRIAELYENGDASSRDLVDALDYEISPTTVLNIHDEFYGGAS